MYIGWNIFKETLAFLSVALIFIGNPSVEQIICMVAIEEECEITISLSIQAINLKSSEERAWYC